MSSTSTWDVLPSEALLNIFTPLDIVSVRSCALVCHHWRAVADAPCLWKRFLACLTGGIQGCKAVEEDVEGDAVKALTAGLYMWGGKVLEVPGTTLRNRLTSPTLVPRMKDVEGDIIGEMGLIPDGTFGDRSEVRAVAAGEDFCSLLSWSGTVCDTRALERDPTEGSRLSWASRRHLFVERWSPPGEFITKVAAGGGADGSLPGGHVLAISSLGQVWSWGSNSHGQLGLGVVDEFIYHPEKVFEASEASKIVGAACGKLHSAIWSDNGSFFACGDNSQGACGHPEDQKQISVFLRVELPRLKVLHAACADANTIICSNSGHVWVAGDNSRSQCGPLAVESYACFKFSWIDPETAWNGPHRIKPNDFQDFVEKEVQIVQVAASSVTLYALGNNGEVYAWGSGSQGELGTGGACKSQCNPIKLPWASKIKSIVGAAGGRFASAIDTHGRLYTWGEGKYGQLGHGDTNKRTTGRAVKTLYGYDVISVACGSDFMMGVTSWKMWQHKKNQKVISSGTSRSTTFPSLFSCGSLEEKTRVSSSSGKGNFKYIKLHGASSFKSSSSSRKVQNTQRKQTVRQDFHAHDIKGDISDKDMDISAGSSPSEAFLVPVELQQRNSRGHHNNENVSSASGGALPIPVKRKSRPLGSANRNPQTAASRHTNVPEPDRDSKKVRKNHAMLRRRVKAFANDPKERELFFPAELSSCERYKVHVAANQFGLSHESVGVEPNRQIRVWKPLHRRRPANIPMHDYCGKTPELDATTINDLGSNSGQAMIESYMDYIDYI